MLGMPQRKHRRLSAFPTIAEQSEDVEVQTPVMSVQDTVTSNRKASNRTPFVEIWPRDNAPTEVIRGRLSEDQIASWLDQKDDFAYANRVPSRIGALRLLLTNRTLDQNRKAIGMTFSDATLRLIASRLQLPVAFMQMLSADQIEPPRFSHNSLFDMAGNQSGISLAIHFQRWRLESLTLGLTSTNTATHPHNHQITTAILVENSPSPTHDSFIHYILSQPTYLTHPLFLPLVCTELMLDVHRSQLDRTVLRLRNLESAIGVHDHDYSSSSSNNNKYNQAAFYTTQDKSPLPDFPFMARSLNGEATRLALYQAKVDSSVRLLRTILRGQYFGGGLMGGGLVGQERRLTWGEQANLALREKAEFLLGWNVDLGGRVEGQRRIAKILRGSVQNLLQQREHRQEKEILATQKGDSNTMRSIAITLIVFLPGAFIAILFSTSMFNFQSKHRDGLVSEWFWLYWAITGPVTAAGLMLWIWWVRPWV